jgi:outer membrane receptor protein involved in Fe transport
MTANLLSIPGVAGAVIFLGTIFGSGPAAARDTAAGSDEISLESLLDIVVTATLREQTTLDAPASIEVVGAEEIRARGYRNIKQIMNDVPGFNDVSDTNEEVVAVRGIFASTTNTILIMVNGHRMNDLMLGRYNTDQFLGMDVVERVEFIRGPASALYGTGALVGIVNIITKKGADVAGTRLRLQGGPYGQQASATWGRQSLGYDVLFNFTYFNALGQIMDQPARYDVAPPGGVPQDGQVYLNRYRENLSGLMTIRTERSALVLRAAHFRRVTPRGSNGSFYDYQSEVFKPAYTENDFFADHTFNWTLGKNKITFNPSVHYFSYYEQSFITFGANDLPPLGSRSGMLGEFNNYQLRLTYERQALESLNVIAGLDGLLASFYRADAWSIPAGGSKVEVTPNGYTKPGKWFLGGAFAQAVWSPIKQISLTGGARLDTFQGQADPEVTPRLGLVYKPSESLAVKALYGRSYLAPMWAHTQANDGNFIGNPNLNPQRFEGADFIVAFSNKWVNASLDLFYNQVTGLINSVRQQDIDPVTGLPRFDEMGRPILGSQYLYDNTPGSTYMGAELAANGQLTNWLRLRASYSLIAPDTRRMNPSSPLLVGGQIKDISRHTFRYGLQVDPVPRLSLSVWGRAYLSTKTFDPMNGDTIPAVALIDSSISYEWGRWRLQLVATNLTNRRYERGGIPGARPLLRMGLNVEGVVELRF